MVDRTGRAQRVYLIYGLSGFVSLGYQVCWFRIFTDRFGSTNETFALVVCNFIGGLGVGALASRRVVEWIASWARISDRLRLYGLVELLVMAAALATFAAQAVPAGLWGSFPYVPHNGIYEPTIASRLARAFIASACVFIPAFFMGITFPLLCEAFQRTPGAGTFPSALYAWNTLGACAGILACQFVFIASLGHTSTFSVIAAINLLLGLFFLVTGGAPGPSEEPAAPSPVSSRRHGRAVRPVGSSRSDEPFMTPGALLACATLSGALAGALEGDLFKRFTFAVTNWNATMAVISFWAILAIFIGSAAVRAYPSLRLSHIKVAFTLALLYLAAAWRLVYPTIGWLKARSGEPLGGAIPEFVTGRPAGFPQGLGQLVLFAGIYVFPPYLLVSILFPWVCNRIQQQRGHVGFVYGLNTLAFCLGLIGFTLVAPRVNVFYSMKLFMVLAGVAVGLLWLIPRGKPLALWKPAIALALGGVGCVLTPAVFDRTYADPDSPAARYPVRAMMSDGASTTYVVSIPGDDRLFFDNFSMSGSNLRGQTYMRLMAHFPLLAQEQPKDALLICFGVGNTLAAIAAHESIRHIDVVDLNANVFRTAPEFARTNNRVWLDPRVRLIHDDGRRFLDLTDRSYDLITSEPPPPMFTGVYRLYSREYYEAALARLTPEGMMTQWLPVYQMPREAVDLAISTFVRVFPHTLLFAGVEEEFILLGGRAPFDLSRIERRFGESASARADLRRLGISKPLSLVARIVRGEASLKRDWGNGRVISDQRNELEHCFPDPARPAVISYDPIAVLGEIGADRLAMGRELRGVLTHLGRLSYHVTGFPARSLATVRETGAGNVALAGLDWPAISKMYRAIGLALRGGRRGEAMEILRRGLALSQEQPRLLIAQAEQSVASDDSAGALAALKTFMRIEPDESAGYRALGVLMQVTGRERDALEAFRKAVALDPDDGKASSALAWMLATDADPALRDPDEAVRLAERASRLAGEGEEETLLTLAAAYASVGHFDQAVAAARTTIARAEGHDDKGLADQARRHLALYERGLTLVGQ